MSRAATRSAIARRTIRRGPIPLVAFAVLAAASSPSTSQRTPPRLETVAWLSGDQPAGIAISHGGRLFVTFPRHQGPVRFTVAEIVGGRPRAFPDAAINETSLRAPEGTLFSVQTLWIDGEDRLWMLDTGVTKVGEPPIPGAPKIVVVSLGSSRVVRTIAIPASALAGNSALKDLRLAPDIGPRGTAFITDSAPGREALIVLDLATGTAVRRLEGALAFGGRAPAPVVDGQRLLENAPGKPPRPFNVGLNAIELGRDGRTLYLGPFTGGRLLGLPSSSAADRTVGDLELSKELRTIGAKPVAGHFAMDASGRLYSMDMERNAITRRDAAGVFRVLVQDRRLEWPDTMAISAGCLYVTTSQYNRGPRFNGGRDERRPPFGIFRLPVEGGSCRPAGAALRSRTSSVDAPQGERADYARADAR